MLLRIREPQASKSIIPYSGKCLNFHGETDKRKPVQKLSVSGRLPNLPAVQHPLLTTPPFPMAGPHHLRPWPPAGPGRRLRSISLLSLPHLTTNWVSFPSPSTAPHWPPPWHLTTPLSGQTRTRAPHALPQPSPAGQITRLAGQRARTAACAQPCPGRDASPASATNAEAPPRRPGAAWGRARSCPPASPGPPPAARCHLLAHRQAPAALPRCGAGPLPCWQSSPS